MADVVKKISVIKVFKDAFLYMESQWKPMLLFMFVHFLICALSDVLDGPSGRFFWVAAAAYYVFLVYFFRCYFNRKPYFLLKVVVGSLGPSLKIILLSVAFVVLLTLLPFVPFFLGLTDENPDKYIQFVRDYVQNSGAFSLILSLLMLLAAPVLFYAPIMAWLSSILGRSGSLKNAYNRTQGNYWQFLEIAFLMNLPVVVFSQLEINWNINDLIIWFLVSPLMIYFNVVFAKIYDFFFLE